MCLCVLVAQLRPALCNPKYCSPLDSSFPEILQARILGCHSLLRVSSQPRDQTWVFCIAGTFFIIRATREAHSLFLHLHVSLSLSFESAFYFKRQGHRGLQMVSICHIRRLKLKSLLFVQRHHEKHPCGGRMVEVVPVRVFSS